MRLGRPRVTFQYGYGHQVFPLCLLLQLRQPQVRKTWDPIIQEKDHSCGNAQALTCGIRLCHLLDIVLNSLS